jgi:hypothetical protein
MNPLKIRRALGAMALLVPLATATGCTPAPKLVSHVTGARDQMKFLVVQGRNQEVVKCQVNPDGSLAQCRKLAVILQDE